jgi:NAD(P)-dependent dehydrogenase (short-subunit alcohol dehydrogenase family)
LVKARRVFRYLPSAPRCKVCNEALTDEVVAGGGRAVFDGTDVSTVAGGQALVQQAVDEFGTVDALALLAGRIPLSPLADISEDEWDGVITSHMKGHLALIQAAAPVMKEKRYGRIVGFSSMQGTLGRAVAVRARAGRSARRRRAAAALGSGASGSNRERGVDRARRLPHRQHDP